MAHKIAHTRIVPVDNRESALQPVDRVRVLVLFPSRQLGIQVQEQLDVAKLAAGIEDFCGLRNYS